MAIRTKYQIFCTQKTAPVLTTYDKVSAYVEYNEYIRNSKGDMYRLAQEVEAVGDLTKQEEYVLLVYRVRKAIRRYYDGGRKHEDLTASLELESELDKWNKRTEDFMAGHPGWKPRDTESHAFYTLVSEWRKVWHERISRFAVTVYQDDQRLMASTDEDKFLALLLDADCRKTLLMTKRCRYCFGQTAYHWRKVAGECALVATSSNMVEAERGGRYYGRGWVLAPNIVTLRRWIEENMKEV